MCLFHLPSFEYFKFGNIFSSSFEDFNYKIFPNPEKNTVKVVVWRGFFSLEKSESVFEEEFSIKETLKEELELWLKTKHKTLK